MEDKRASFLVRVWEEPEGQTGGQPEWRASVEFIESEEKHYFQDMESLLAFLRHAVEDFEQAETKAQQVIA